MSHTIYEDPITHRFTIVALPHEFVDGDTVLIPLDLRWCATQEEALAMLPELMTDDDKSH